MFTQHHHVYPPHSRIKLEYTSAQIWQYGRMRRTNTIYIYIYIYIIAAYGYAPASIVTPLGAVGVLTNAIITIFVLREPFRKMQRKFDHVCGCVIDRTLRISLSKHTCMFFDINMGIRRTLLIFFLC